MMSVLPKRLCKARNSSAGPPLREALAGLGAVIVPVAPLMASLL
jgi:hypothetical protein